jgi:PDDEXK-like domain of unknown function (DUF3799)
MQSVPWDGKKIREASIVRSLSNAAYHEVYICEGGPSVSSSLLRKVIQKSPAHAFELSPLNPSYVADVDDNEAMILGRFVHKAVASDPADPVFDDCVLCPPTVKGEPYNGRLKVWRDWKAEQAAAGRYVITPDLAERAKGMILALGKFPLVQQGMLGGAPERSLFWRDQRGFWKKARPDEIPNDSGDFVELKTIGRLVLYRDMQRAIIEHGYHQQAAMVMEGARALGIPPTSFTFLFVESKPPYCVRAVTLKDEDIARGHALNELACDIFWQCYQTSHWPGPGDDRPDAEYIDLPDWYRKSVDDRIKYQLREVT